MYRGIQLFSYKQYPSIYFNCAMSNLTYNNSDHVENI